MLKISEKSPSLKISLIVFLLIIGVLISGLFYFKIKLQYLLLIDILITVLAALSTKQKSIFSIIYIIKDAFFYGFPAIQIFIFIGILISAFIQSGTIATLLCYGVSILSPAIFLPACVLLCSVMSLTIGSSWSTVGVLGTFFLGLGQIMNIPAPIVVGAITSGACFGDKMSAVSDTTNLSAIVADVSVRSHIKSMMYTVIPAYIITITAFILISTKYATHVISMEKIDNVIQILSSTYEINIISIAPMLLVIILPFFKLTPRKTLLIAILFAIALAIFVQNNNFFEVLKALVTGSHLDMGKDIGVLKNHTEGGILAMLPTLSITILTLILGGLLHHLKFLYVVMLVFLKRIKKTGTLVFSTIFSCFLSNLSMGEAYMSIILNGKLYKDIYNKHGLNRTILSRSLEDGATFTTFLIPWTTSGLFFYATLNVPVIEYAPWALLNWISPLISIIFAFFGFAVWKVNKKLNDNRV